MADDVTSLLEDLDLNSITDPNMRRCIVGLLNIVQQLSAENARLREENQRQRDEIARLKGEQGKPDIKPNNTRGGTGTDHSSEKRRKQKKPHRKRKKKGLERPRITQQPSHLA